MRLTPRHTYINVLRQGLYECPSLGPKATLVRYGSKRTAHYVLFALDNGFTFEFSSTGAGLRSSGPDLVPDLGISDTQFGLLTGFGFACSTSRGHSALARFAIVAHRVWITTVCVALWSLMRRLLRLRHGSHHPAR